MGSQRIPALDGIRGLAITLVLLWHGAFGTFGVSNSHRVFKILFGLGKMTWSGVDLFFVLSGFLIGGILLDEVKSEAFFKPFYLRRFFRIVPLYSIVLVFAWIIESLFRGSEWIGIVAPPAYYILFLQNIWAAIHGTTGTPLLAATWSLAIEEQFYLTLPAVVRNVKLQTLTKLLVATIAIAPILRILAFRYSPNGLTVAYVLTPFRADALAMGALCAVLYRNAKAWTWITEHRRVVIGALLTGIGGLGIILLNGYDFKAYRYFGLEFSLLATTYSLLLLTALMDQRAARIFSFRWLRYMGTIAYGVYLLHMPLMAIAQEGLARFLPRRWFTVFTGSLIGIAATIALAALSWKYFERPLVKFGHRFGYQKETTASWSLQCSDS